MEGKGEKEKETERKRKKKIHLNGINNGERERENTREEDKEKILEREKKKESESSRRYHFKLMREEWIQHRTFFFYSFIVSSITLQLPLSFFLCPDFYVLERRKVRERGKREIERKEEKK